MRVTIGPYPGSKSKKERTVKIKIDKYDTWNMDHTLAYIILPMLKQLKETKHGAPNTDDEDVPEHLRSVNAAPKENEWDTDSLHFERWDWILEQMIWSFEQELDENAGDQFHTGEIEMFWQPIGADNNPIGEHQGKYSDVKHTDAVSYRMVKGPNDTHQYDAEGAAQFYDRQQNGFKLFGKYYSHLWD